MKTHDSRLASNTLYLMNPGTSCSVHNCKTEENQCYSRTDTGETSTASYEYCNLTLTNEDVPKRKFLSD